MASNRMVGKLLQNEGIIGTFNDLCKLGKRDDHLTPHHMPPDAYMQAKVLGYTARPAGRNQTG
jgi:hypothetical protein